VAGIAKREVFPPTATKSSYTINPTRRLRDHRCPMQQASGAQASEPVLACLRAPAAALVCVRALCARRLPQDGHSAAMHARTGPDTPPSLPPLHLLVAWARSSVAAPLSAAQAAATGPRSRPVARVGGGAPGSSQPFGHPRDRELVREKLGGNSSAALCPQQACVSKLGGNSSAALCPQQACVSQACWGQS
jgi:hypothetical protein